MFTEVFSKTFSTLPEILDAPTNLIASMGDCFDKVILQWNPSIGAEKYIVFRRLSAGGVLVQIAETTDAAYEDFDVNSGTLYTYYVAAYTVYHGYSDISNMAEGKTGVQTQAPVNIGLQMPVYTLYTDEEGIDIIFYMPRTLLALDNLKVYAYKSSTNEEIFITNTLATKNFDNICSWNSDNIPVKPKEPINILLKCEVDGTNVKGIAILQLKNRTTEKEVGDAVGTGFRNSGFGKIIW